jgi:hypothetical protein
MHKTCLLLCLENSYSHSKALAAQGFPIGQVFPLLSWPLYMATLIDTYTAGARSAWPGLHSPFWCRSFGAQKLGVSASLFPGGHERQDWDLHPSSLPSGGHWVACSTQASRGLPWD